MGEVSCPLHYLKDTMPSAKVKKKTPAMPAEVGLCGLCGL